jgi:hypothetical protein
MFHSIPTNSNLTNTDYVLRTEEPKLLVIFKLDSEKLSKIDFTRKSERNWSNEAFPDPIKELNSLMVKYPGFGKQLKPVIRALTVTQDRNTEIMAEKESTIVKLQ